MKHDRPSISTVAIELLQGVEGVALLIEDQRVAGPKAWGGGRVVHHFRVPVEQIVRAIGETKLRVGTAFAQASKPALLDADFETGRSCGIAARQLGPDGELALRLNVDEHAGTMHVSRGFVVSLLDLWPPEQHDDHDLVDEDPSWECPSCGETWSAREHARWRERHTNNTVDAITCPLCEHVGHELDPQLVAEVDRLAQPTVDALLDPGRDAAARQMVNLMTEGLVRRTDEPIVKNASDFRPEFVREAIAHEEAQRKKLDAIDLRHTAECGLRFGDDECDCGFGRHGGDDGDEEQSG